MTNDIKAIKEHLTHSSSSANKLTYLVAIGEIEQANKTALAMIVEKLMSLYYEYDYYRADKMNEYLSSILPSIQKLGITLPDYVMTGEQFIDYMNNLTGNNVPYTTSHLNQIIKEE